MSSPTTRASNVWQVDAQDDLLQLSAGRGGVILGGIDSTGAPFGNLAQAGGGTPGGSTGDLQFNNAGVFSSATEINIGASASLSSEGNVGMTSPGFFHFTSTSSSIACDAALNASMSSSEADITLDANQNVSIFAENGGITFNATTGFIGLTALSYSYDLGGLLIFASNADAIAGGLGSGSLYRTGADPDVVCVVH